MNFQCDCDGDSIGLHFNPRQGEEDVVLNALVGGDWGDEQRGFENEFAFRRGEFFDAFFIATEDKFNVSCLRRTGRGGRMEGERGKREREGRGGREGRERGK